MMGQSLPGSHWHHTRKKHKNIVQAYWILFSGCQKIEKLSKTLENGLYSDFNARHIITPLRSRLSPDGVEAISVNLEIYKNP